jgi:hypothetical protein
LESTVSQLPHPELQEEIRQLPPEQVSEALSREQEDPQEPQLDSVSSEVSHPLLSTESQFSHSELQEAMRQLPPEQVAVAWAREQVRLQALQCWSVSRDCSQPLGSFPSQLSQWVLQLWIRQPPVAQVGVAWARWQVTPHCPQSFSVFSGVSQPFASLPSQVPQRESQVSMRQEQVAQVAVAWAREQAVPQVPQFCRVFSGISQPVSSFPSQLP